MVDSEQEKCPECGTWHDSAEAVKFCLCVAAAPVIEVALNRCPGCDEYGASHTTPSIEHPAVPATCEYCGPECYRGAAHNARVEDGARYTDDPVPAVPAQEAPREPADWVPPICVKCNKPLDGVQGSVRRCLTDGHHCIWRSAVPAQEAPRVIYRDADGNYPDEPTCPLETMNWGDGKTEPLTEPQAGAQVPSQDALAPGWLQRAANRVHAELTELDRLREALTHIKSYATEAAKTPITREDMHDPLKAQTFFDEHEGFIRLVLSEIGRPTAKEVRRLGLSEYDRGNLNEVRKATR